MKKTLLILTIGLLSYNLSFSQATKQLNFGLIGASFDIPLATNVSIAPMARTNFDISHLVVGVKADYYFDNLIGIPEAFDFYAGANAGYRIYLNDTNGDVSNLDMGLEVGGRWFWSDKWGINLELSGGVGYGGMIGLTMKL